MVMNVDEAIDEAAGALKQGEQANWRLAQLTYEHTLRRGEYQNPGEKIALDAWCSRIRDKAREKFSVNTGRAYRAAWAYRITLETSDMPALYDVLRRIDPAHYDTDQVQARVYATGLEKHLTEAAAEEKAETLARLLADPAVLALAVPFGSPLSRALADAIDTQRALREERLERLVEADPISLQQRNATSLTQITGLLSRFAEDIAARLPHVRGLPDPGDDATAQTVFLREALLRAESAIASVKALLTTGRVGGDVDQFVSGVLSEQER